MLCKGRLFYISPMEMTREYFFIREKAVKTWGLTGQNGGRGEFLWCLTVHCNPIMEVDLLMLVFFVYCSPFFACTHVCILQWLFTVFLFNKVFLNWIELNVLARSVSKDFIMPMYDNRQSLEMDIVPSTTPGRLSRKDTPPRSRVEQLPSSWLWGTGPYSPGCAYSGTLLWLYFSAVPLA